MWFVHHFLRTVWANIMGFFFNLAFLNDKSYAMKKKQFDELRELTDLQNWFRDVYKYKWDCYKGILDHNNFEHEFICSNGDCEDMAYYACKKLKKMYNGSLSYCRMRGYANLSKKFWHYDCVFQFNGDGDYYLFNYGNTKSGKSFKELDGIMCEMYKKKYNLDKVTSWECIWR